MTRASAPGRIGRWTPGLVGQGVWLGPFAKRRVRNQSVKSELKTLVRQTREAVEAGDKDKALAALRVASRKLDVAVSKGVIHKNQAANRKSKLARRVASLGD